ncbi:MAG: hypothetical protein ACI9Z7_001379 [Alteromonas macleodii]
MKKRFSTTLFYVIPSEERVKESTTTDFLDFSASGDMTNLVKMYEFAHLQLF